VSRFTLECAPDVAEKLRLLLPEAPPKRPWEGDLSLLTGIPVIERPEWERGRYRLTGHDACTVDAEAQEVTHENCPVLSEGSFSE
jgi:hypothetical protein